MRARIPTLLAFGSTFWTAGLQLLAVRVYLALLGVEAYGVIGFFLSLQATLQILDLGLAPAMNREMARARALGTMEQARVLLRTLATIYWVAGLVIATALALLAPVIAGTWLNPGRLGLTEVTHAVMLMGAILAVRWPVAIYYNALVGLGHLGEASLFNAAMSSLSIGGSIGAIALFKADLPTLFAAQAVVALITVLIVRILAWRRVGRAEARFEWAALRHIWRFSLAMGGVTLTSMALTQLDKVILSRVLTLERFGAYMIAASLTAGLMLAIAPLLGIIFPRFSALVANGRDAELTQLYHDGSQLFAILFLPVVLAVGLYAEPLVTVWTGRADTAVEIAPVVLLLALGYGINGVMFFPYSLQLALGLSRVPLAINVAALVLMVPLVTVLATRYGMVGAAAAWPAEQVLYLFVGTVATHRYSNQGSPLRWILHSFVLPFSTVLAVMLVLRLLVLHLSDRPLVTLVGAGTTVVVTWFTCALFHPAAVRALRANQELLSS